MPSKSHLFRDVLAGIFLIALSGCAATEAKLTVSSLESGWFDGAGRTIAVVPIDDPPAQISFYVFWEAPNSDSARVTKAAGSMAMECLDLNTGGDGIAAGIGALLTLGCIPIAATVGATKASKEARELRKSYYPATKDMTWLLGTRETFAERSIGRKPEALVTRKIVSLLQARPDHDVRLEISQKDPETLLRKGWFDKMLEISTTEFGLVIEQDSNQDIENLDIALLVVVSVRSYSLSGEYIVLERQGSMKYLGKTHKYSDLLAPDGRLLDREIEQGANFLAELVVN